MKASEKDESELIVCPLAVKLCCTPQAIQQDWPAQAVCLRQELKPAAACTLLDIVPVDSLRLEAGTPLQCLPQGAGCLMDTVASGNQKPAHEARRPCPT
jgi:hypothetical protein